MRIMRLSEKVWMTINAMCKMLEPIIGLVLERIGIPQPDFSIPFLCLLIYTAGKTTHYTISPLAVWQSGMPLSTLPHTTTLLFLLLVLLSIKENVLPA